MGLHGKKNDYHNLFPPTQTMCYHIATLSKYIKKKSRKHSYIHYKCFGNIWNLFISCVWCIVSISVYPYIINLSAEINAYILLLSFNFFSEMKTTLQAIYCSINGIFPNCLCKIPTNFISFIRERFNILIYTMPIFFGGGEIIKIVCDTNDLNRIIHF